MSIEHGAAGVSHEEECSSSWCDKLEADVLSKLRARRPALLEARRLARTSSALLATISVYADGDIRLRPEL